jgi:POT family proton-dependent oligopeptide transporter
LGLKPSRKLPQEETSKFDYRASTLTILPDAHYRDMATKDPDISVALSTKTEEASSRYSTDDSTPPVIVLASDKPTKEELNTLRRVPGRLPWTAQTIAFVEMCERLSFCGTIAVFVNFIQQPLPKGSVTGAGFHGQSGALGMGQRPATAITTCKMMSTDLTGWSGEDH